MSRVLGLVAILVALVVPAGAVAFAPGDVVEVFGTGTADDGRTGEVIASLTNTSRDTIALDGSASVQTYSRSQLRIKLPPPTASYSYSPSAPVAGQAITLDATASTCPASPCTYAWTADSSSIGQGQTLTWTSQTAGDKTVTLSVTDSRNRSATAMKIITVSSPPPPSGSTELARGKTATASSTSTSSGAPAAANDGNVGTRWSSNYAASGEWWRVDLGGTAALTSIEIDWENATASPYSIQVSNDGSSWTTVATQTITVDVPDKPAYVTIKTNVSGTGRYVRVLQGGRGPGNCCYGMSFWEVRAYGSFTGGTTEPPPPPPVGSGGEGVIQIAKPHQKDLDSYTLAGNNGDASIRTFYQTHYDRLRYYDSPPAIYGLDWLPPGWVYKDTYAVYNSPNQYVLKDTDGNYLRIPFGCSDGTRCQYAANVCDPAWRSQWIRAALTSAAKFGGLFADDFNVQMKVAGASGPDVWTTGGPTPINYLDGTTLTSAEWAECMATNAEEIDAAMGASEWVPNIVPFHAGGITNPQVQRVLKASDFWELERGTINNGSFDARFADAQYEHSIGKGVVLDFQDSSGNVEYQRASYLCISSGHDYVGGSRMTPGDWWSGWDLDLGNATSTCAKGADGIWRRSFERGSVSLNPSTLVGSVSVN